MTMWVSRKDYDRQLTELVELRTEQRALTQLNATIQATLDWARVRLTQVEHERAQLLFNYTGVKILSPSIEKERVGPTVQSAIDSAPSFEDIGDEAARKLGIGWNDDGTLKSKE
jgi:hypothetical protein